MEASDLHLKPSTMNSTNTNDREQWRNRILRALAELQPAEKSADQIVIASEKPAEQVAAAAVEI